MYPICVWCRWLVFSSGTAVPEAGPSQKCRSNYLRERSGANLTAGATEQPQLQSDFVEILLYVVELSGIPPANAMCDNRESHAIIASIQKNRT